jgi:hypothetical protein
MNFTKLALPVIALGAAAVLLTPGSSDAYSLIGGSLTQSQRDFRTFNNFTDNAANNNNTPATQFPGAQGAVMAIWKGTAEWGSELHGNGNGDPHQNGGLGSGGANFDTTHQGEAIGVGGTNDNIHSELSGGSGGVLAFTETPISNGWRIRYYQSWTWNDGPGTSIGSGIDIQGVACHEYGHALGLGHSTSGGATMFPSISGNGVAARSINSDDSNGVQAIYGAKSGTKPSITGYTIAGSQLTVNGTGFNTTGNQVWFTQAGSGGTGQAVKVTNVSSPSGTSLTVTIPANAGPGDILVRRNSTANSGLSNAFPSDLQGAVGTSVPVFASASPASIAAVIVDGPGVVTFTGQNFTGLTEVKVDGVTLTAGLPPQYSVPNDNTLVINWPLVSKLGSITVEATNGSGTTSTSYTVVANEPPVFDMGNSAPAFLITGSGLTLTAGAKPGDIFYLVASPSNAPTNIPGIVNMAIGNNYTSIFIIATPVIPARGFVSVTVPILGLPTGFNVYTQGAVLRVANGFSLPATTTNVQTGTVLF